MTVENRETFALKPQRDTEVLRAHIFENAHQKSQDDGVDGDDGEIAAI